MMQATQKIPRPQPSEYPSYSSIYMDLVGEDKPLLEQLWNNFLELKAFVYGLPEETLYFRYEEGKWTIKEILVHLIDDERIFTYRALRYGRNDDTPLHGFDQDAYALESRANERSLDNIFKEYESVRKATLTLFENLPEETHLRSGEGIDYDGSIINKRTVRALAYHIAGHELRHFNIIKERYVNL